MKNIQTTTLYRPVGFTEMQYVKINNAFPPRFDWQPIFYPVTNEAYAIEICKWNIEDEASGYAGFVTQFEVDSNYLESFEIKNVGGHHHNELWIPSEELEMFNQNIVGPILIIHSFFGEKYKGKK